MAVMARHVREDVGLILPTSDASLHSRRDNFQLCDRRFEKFCGAYEYVNQYSDEVIRAGKASAGFLSRHAQHQAAASERVASSKFYLQYPSKTRPGHGGSPPMGGGFFEDLEHRVGLAFDPGDRRAEKALTQDGGLFEWPKECLVGEAKIPGAWTRAAKRLVMVAYGWELLYDLMIAPSVNVSEAPGFEAVNGSFKRSA